MAIALASVLLVLLGIAAYYFTTLEVQQQASTPTEAAGSAVEANEQHREQAQQAILAYEQQYQPLLARSQIQSFAPAKHQQATQAYELALQAFAQSQFREVETHLKHSIAMAEKLQKRWLEAADSWYQQAEQALTQQRPQEAQLYVQKLTAVNDQDTRIKGLQQRIDGFAQQQHCGASIKERWRSEMCLASHCIATARSSATQPRRVKTKISSGSRIIATKPTECSCRAGSAGVTTTAAAKGSASDIAYYTIAR